MTEQADGLRAALVEAAQARWIAALTDLGGRNTCSTALTDLGGRNTCSTTGIAGRGRWTLAAADPVALGRFLQTGSIRMTRLFHDADARADAIRRCRPCRQRARRSPTAMSSRRSPVTRRPRNCWPPTPRNPGPGPRSSTPPRTTTRCWARTPHGAAPSQRCEHLQRLGWSFDRLGPTNWFGDPHGEVAKVRDAYRRAVDATEPAVPDEAGPPVQAPGPSGDVVRRI